MLITIDGSDFSGKTTQISILKNTLCNKFPGHEIIFTREPGGVEISEKIREFYKKNLNSLTNPISQLFLMLAARTEHLEQLIIPALKDNKIIICDRFFDSTLVYQGYIHGITKTVKKFHKLFLMEFPNINLTPDITIFLNIATKEICKRAESRDGISITKDSEFYFRKITSAYSDIADKNPARVKIVESQQDVEKTHKEILEIITQAINLKFNNKKSVPKNS